MRTRRTSTPCGRCRKRPRSSVAAACASRSKAKTCASSKRSCARRRRPATATRPPRSSACARRSRARRACSRTSASCRTRRPKWSRLNGRSSRATSGSSMLSAVEYVESLSPWPKDGFGLERIKALLAELGEPQRAYPSIHVVGTNGKSSVTRTIEALLAQEGLAVGAYLSPHVRGWSERIRVRGEEALFEEAVARVRAPAERLQATQFEVLTAAALAEFAG